MPISSRLRERLDERRRWFERWLSRWQMIGGQNLVEIDSFGGEPIRTCGLDYSGTIVTIFWDTLTRGLRKEIVAQFEWIEAQVQGKPISQAEQTINICAGQLVTFAESIRRMAVAKDRTLRSKGVLPKAFDQGRWEGADRDAVMRQARGLIDSLKAGTLAPVASTDKRTLWNRLPSWLQIAAALVTIAGGATAMVGAISTIR